MENGNDGKYDFAEILIRNISDIPAYPVTVDLSDDWKRFFLDDNFFMLKPHEEKKVRLTSCEGEIGDILVGFWNGDGVVV